MMACRCADEFAGFSRKEIGNGAGIAPLDGLASQDYGAAIDFGGIEPRLAVGVLDEAGQLADIDRVVSDVRRQQYWRLPENFPFDHDEAAGQRSRKPLEMDTGEHKVRCR